MPINIQLKGNNINFEGLYSSITELKNDGGIYYILRYDSVTGSYNILDKGISDNIKAFLQNSRKRFHWKRADKGLYFATKYCHKKERTNLYEDI